ncbi:MAG: hypothetical protein ACI9UA_001695 [Pseudoalteromonas tetraodonis]|jgi:hypothetical protein
MKTFLSTLAAAGLLTSASSGSLILTGIIDGSLSGGTPKAIELFVVSDIADLSLYGVELVSNAGTSAGAIESVFTGSATAGDYLYIASEAINSALVFGEAPNTVTGDINHNGDDDVYIYGPSGLIDVWGGSDGIDNSGTVADVLDSWAYRVNGTGPSTTFDDSEWTIAPINSLDGLDAAGMAAATTFGTYAVPEPGAFALIGLAGVFSILRRRR